MAYIAHGPGVRARMRAAQKNWFCDGACSASDRCSRHGRCFLGFAGTIYQNRKDWFAGGAPRAAGPKGRASARLEETATKFPAAKKALISRRPFF